MALTVVVRSGDASSPPRVSFDSPRIVIGRGDGCEIRLPDPSVSHRHASIRQRGTDYIVIDEGSTNGTFVGPVRLSPQAPRVLKSGDLIRIGRIWLEVRIEQVLPTQNGPLATKELALSLVAQALAAQGEPAGPELFVTDGPDRDRRLSLGEFERVYVLGRGKDCDLCLSDPDASRRHVEVFRRGDQVYVRDLGSKNGSKLAGLALTGGKEQPWATKSSLEFGRNTFSYVDPVLDALLELEHGADELMRDDESIDPPCVSDRDASAATMAATPARDGGDAPIAVVPQRTNQSAQRRRTQVTDLLVAGLALIVLAVSVLGLLWLFRSE